MNKILMDGEIFRLETSMDIEVNGKSTIYIYDNKDDIDLNIKMHQSSELLILDFNLFSKNTNIMIEQSDDSKVDYIHTFKIDDKYKFNYVAKTLGNNNINNVWINGVSKGNVNLSVDVISTKKTTNNILNENIKVLNIGGKVETNPKMHINSLDIIANHNTAISNIREDNLFYLNSKGISRENAIKLIEDGYLYGLFKKYDEFYKLIDRR